MPKLINKIIGSEKRIKDGHEYLAVRVEIIDELGNKEDGVCYVGGSVEVFMVGQEIRAFVKKHKALDTL